MAKIKFMVLAFSISLLAACGGAPMATPATAAPTMAAPTSAPINLPTPSVILAPPLTPTLQPTPTGNVSIQDQFAQIDTFIRQRTDASIAFNAPNTMKLDETLTINLLMNPSLTDQQLATQVTGSGPVKTATIEITPRMRAILIAADADALTIQPIQDNSEQVISGTETTQWSWMVTAKKAGLQTLTLTIFRLVQYEGKDYWRNVQAYQAQIKVNVTFWQKIASIDWKWLFSLLPISLLWAWIAKLFKSRKSNTPKNGGD